MAKTKYFSSVYVGITIAVICLALVVIFKPANIITGSAVEIKYHGVSDQPLAAEAGKIQTYVKLSKESINDLKYDLRSADIEIAENILEVADFENGLIELYKTNPAVSVKTADYSAIKEGARILGENFKINTKCIINSGLHVADAKEMEFVVVTELKYSNCEGSEYQGNYNSDNNWKTAIAKHNFYTLDGHLICSNRDSPILFVINKKSGEMSSNTAGC